ncbi:MAG: RHS repeat-associated core domain-containing protein [Saprospiraceae bacterium]|nr:RHS repeat-associated core domain-containing protein [Saprospiraceae bacterium]MBP9189622.1 RHS repeat-associated core domain-containing protein [Chitinophagales bacterium]
MNPSKFPPSPHYPFGMLTPGRNWSAGSEYRFGFNGKESDTETYGDGNAYDFGARIYDARLGRWMSVDPMQAEYPDLSPYVFVANSPLIFIDPDGKKIVNVYTLRRQAAETTLKLLNDDLIERQNRYGSIDNRKTFSGTKAEWKEVKSLKNEIKSQEHTVKTYMGREASVDGIIADFKKNSPNLFDRINNMSNEVGEEVDWMLSVENMFDMADNPIEYKAGYNIPDFITGDDGVVRPRSKYGTNTVEARLEIDKADRDWFQSKKGEIIINHEAGHFEIIASRSSEYKAYIEKLQKEGKDLQGGHRADDASGKKATDYGKVKDIEK